MVRVIEVHARESDEAFAKHEGEFFSVTKDIKIYDEDVDVYGISHPDDGEGEGNPKRKLLAKFRKGVISKDDIQIGWDAFRLLAIPSRNRGASAGPIDQKGVYWSQRKPVEITKWSARYMQDGKVSKMRVNNVVASGVIGSYEETPFLGQPCRMTGYTRRGLKQYLHGIPFLEAIDAQFKTLVPDAHKQQLAAIRTKPEYQIGDTAFSTLTINMNFRTALHKDAGDFQKGFGNLSVIEWGHYHGAETMLPRFGVGFNVRSGDFLAMDVHEWHANAAMVETAADKAFNEKLPKIATRNPKTGVVGSNLPYQRISFVCYVREKIMDCSVKETRDYYKTIGFNEKIEIGNAQRLSATLPTLPIPGLTGSLEEAHAASEKRGVRQRHTRGRRVQSERQRVKKHFIEGFF